MKNYYEILGVPKTASAEEIKRAFHQLAHKHHPYKGGDEKKFKEINEAYQVLSDKEKRAQYDKFGRVFEGAQGPGFDGFANGAGPGWDFNWGGGGFSDGEEGAGAEFDFGNLGDIFGDFFGFENRGASRKKNIKKGKDIGIDIEISLEETLKNQEKEIILSKYVVCGRCSGAGAEPGTAINECFSCRGAGEVQQVKRTFLGSFTQWTICPECGGDGQKPAKPCNVCKGEGRVKDDERIKIFIPAGVDSNQTIKVAGKGDAGKKGGAAGDLFVRILVNEHPIFERKGDDLFATAEIGFSQAVLGGEIEISALERTKILLKIPAGIESGKVLRISGKGIPRFSRLGRGNLYIKLVVKTPRKITKRQKDLLEELRREGM